ncbi:MAG: DUF928 domain-containing protein, partial [Thermoleophilia bacterium]|nr:DUF928 domain-containing protein [Thermoleophilia bacterium]
GGPERSAPAPTQMPTPTPNGAPGSKGGLPGAVPGLEREGEEVIARIPEPQPPTQPESGAQPGPALEESPDAAGRIEKPAPVELAEAERVPAEKRIPPTPTPRTPKQTPAPAPAPEAKPDEVLLAAVSALPPPDYAPPAGGVSLVWMRQFGAVRSAPSEARVAARAPRDHTGLTLSSSPRLWWALDKATEHPIQITIVDGESIDPLVRTLLPGPHTAGLHAFDLAKHGAKLSPGVDYRWFVSIVIDPDRPSRNPVSAGSLRVAGEGDARRATVSSADASSRGNRFAELGLWYDAFDFYASLAEAHPDVERLATYRDRLAEVTKTTP